MSGSVRTLVGMLAALVGAAAGHAIAGLLNPAASPVVAVGAVVIDLTPTPVKEWAAATFGTGDKAVLLAGVVVFVAAFGALAGLLLPRRTPAALGLVGALGVVCVAAAWTRPDAGVLDVVPSAVAALVGGWVLVRFPGWLDRTPAASDPHGTVDRRRLLAGGAGLAATGGVLALLGQRLPALTGPDPAVPPLLPAPTPTLDPLPPGLDAPGVTPLRTPTADFYRIDIALAVPRIDHRDWRLTVDGLVSSPLSLGWDDLLALPLVERDITLTCVSNPIGGDLCGSTRWLGVPVAELLRRAGPTAGADMVLSAGSDGFTASTPLEVLLDGRDALVAIAMDGRPLTPVHGAPARLLVPGLYGYVGATKWLTRLEVTFFSRVTAYWTERGWAPRGPVKTACRIDTPRGRVTAGQVAVAGVAWATHRGVGRVELRVDDGPWVAATLSTDVGVDYWRQWVVPWQAASGRHRLTARAWDAAGEVQTADVTDVFPDGATGYHTVVVEVA